MGTQATPNSEAVETSPSAPIDSPTPPVEEISKTALAIGNLPDAIKANLTVRKLQNVVSAQIAATNWGKGLDLETRRAISDWSGRVGIDPAIELNVLGGHFYKNAYYFMRRLSELADANKVVYAYVEHVEVDPRLEVLAKRTDNLELATQARHEIDRRTLMRVQYNIPDKAVGASIFHIMLTTVPHEFSAAKWCGGGTRQKDPVGDEFPVETSETRAIRRTMRLVASQNPAFKPLVEPNDDESIDAMIGDTLREGLKRAKEDQIASAAQQRGHPMAQLNPGDPYGGAPIQLRKETDPIPVAEPAVRSPAIQPLASVPEFQDDRDLLSPEERAAATRE